MMSGAAGQITVIGAGLAGLSAAITLAERGFLIRLIAPQASERAQSVLAEGGINAALDAMGEGDTVEEHVADTLRGGADLADAEAVRGLCAAAPDIVRQLRSLGVPFQTEGGQLIQRHFGGQKKKRTAYVKSSTGKALVTALTDEARRFEAMGRIARLTGWEMADLITEDGGVTGVCMRHVRSGAHAAYAGPVILTVGGLNGFFGGMTTGAQTNSGDAQAAAFSAGAAFANLEMLQYHPTTVRIADKRMLVSEAARGEGGRLFVRRDGKPWYFMEEKYPTLGNLMPRDVVSREMAAISVRTEGRAQVFLDMTGLPDAVWSGRLPDLRAELVHYLGIDPQKEPVPVQPGIHFFMGGLFVDRAHRTSLPGLYAAGECACQYHGANRLGGNSLLGAVYGGRVAAETAAAEYVRMDFSEEPVQTSDGDADVSPVFARRLAGILAGALGIIRDEETIDGALHALKKITEKDGRTEAEERRARLAEAMLLSARERRESRGAHFRSDFPDRDDDRFRKTTVARCAADGQVTVSFSEIGAPPRGETK